MAFSFGLATLPRNLASAFLAAVREFETELLDFDEVWVDFSGDFETFSRFWLFSGVFAGFSDFWLWDEGVGLALAFLPS